MRGGSYERRGRGLEGLEPTHRPVGPGIVCRGGKHLATVRFLSVLRACLGIPTSTKLITWHLSSERAGVSIEYTYKLNKWPFVEPKRKGKPNKQSSNILVLYSHWAWSQKRRHSHKRNAAWTWHCHRRCTVSFPPSTQNTVTISVRGGEQETPTSITKP